MELIIEKKNINENDKRKNIRQKEKESLLETNRRNF